MCTASNLQTLNLRLERQKNHHSSASPANNVEESMLPGQRVTTGSSGTANQTCRRRRASYSLPKVLDAQIGERWKIRMIRRKPTRSGMPPQFSGPGRIRFLMSLRRCTDCPLRFDGSEGRPLSSRSSWNSQDLDGCDCPICSGLCNTGEESACTVSRSSGAAAHRNFSPACRNSMAERHARSPNFPIPPGRGKT